MTSMNQTTGGGEPHSSAPAIDADGTYWLRAGWLVDGRGGAVRRNVLMGIRERRIVHIGPDAPERKAAADFSHATVLPALIDAHVHLVFSGSMDPVVRTAQLNHTPEQARTAIACHLQDHRCCGVAAVRDGGDRRGAVRQYRREHLPAADPPVHVAVTCWAWHAAGRYGGMIGQAPPQAVAPAVSVRAHAQDCDHVKVIQSGLNSLDRFGYQGSPQFGAQDLRDMVRAAHAALRPIMVHANGELAVRMAVEAGCDSIEHGYFMGEENLRRMADRGTVWVPTVVPMAALSEAPDLTGHQQDVARRTLDVQLSQIRKAGEWGVAIVLGTDAGSQGVDHGHAVRQELRWLMNAGLSLAQAVHCATANAARLLRLSDRGELSPGRRADFIAVSGPPEQLPERLAQLEAICIGGEWERRLEVCPLL